MGSPAYSFRPMPTRRPNFAVERTAGSHSLTAAAHRGRWADESGWHETKHPGDGRLA